MGDRGTLNGAREAVKCLLSMGPQEVHRPMGKTKRPLRCHKMKVQWEYQEEKDKAACGGQNHEKS